MDFISSAYAMAGPSAGGGGDNLFASLMPFALIFIVFYFLLIRPQQKKAKEHREMLSSLKKGDAVLTAGGMYGRITDILEGDVMVVDLGETTVKMGRAYLAPAPGSRNAVPQAPKNKKSKKNAKDVESAAESSSVESSVEAPAVEVPAVEAPAVEVQPEAVKPVDAPATPDSDANKDKPVVQ